VSAGGAFLWARDLGAPIDSSPAVADGVVYVGSEDDSLYAVDQTSGKVVWSYATGGQVESSPAVANNMVFVGSDDRSLYAFGLP
jgi:outer membrane protein assembly factor BamB